MYCKHCGKPVEENARFCPSCGGAVATPSQPTPQPAPPKQETPTPFHQDYVDNQHYQYQKQGFKGKQMSTGTSGSISFGSGEKKQRGFFGKLFKFAIIAVALIVIVFIVSAFIGGDPIDNIESGTGIDLVTEEVTGKTTVFSTTDSTIYVLFDYNDQEVGTTLDINLFYGTEEYAMDEYVMNIDYTAGTGYVGLEQPIGGWTVGEYTIEFVLNDELLNTYIFTVE